MNIQQTAAAKLFSELAGKWEGHSKTWLDPQKPFEESSIKSTFEQQSEGPFLRHRYVSSFQNQPRTGEETIVFNSVSGMFEVVWFDSFHMNYALMHSQGEAIVDGFSVMGRYDVGGGHPQWGWKTTYALQTSATTPETSTGNEALTITAWNVAPEGKEDLAIETVLRRCLE